MFPENAHDAALDAARGVLDGPGKGWARRVFFSDNGSTAMEVAVKMAIRAWYASGVGAPGRRSERAGRGASAGARFGAGRVVPRGHPRYDGHAGALRVHWADADPVVQAARLVPCRRPRRRCGAGDGSSSSRQTACASRSSFVRVRLVPRDGTRKHRHGGVRGGFRDARGGFRRRGPLYECARGLVRGQNRRRPGRGGRRLRREPERKPPARRARDGVRFARRRGHGPDRPSVPARADAAMARGLPVVLDEVFAGIWRLGAEGAWQLLRETPDVSCYASALTGGLAPLAVTAATEEVFDAPAGTPRRRVCCTGTRTRRTRWDARSPRRRCGFTETRRRTQT